MTRIACLGEVMVEVSLDGSAAGIGFAGDTFNTAVYLKRQAPALTVSYATKLGQDPLSARITELMRTEALETDLVAISPDRLPGLYAISTDAEGERSFLYWRDQSAYRTLFTEPGLDLTDLATCDLVYLSAISLAVLPQDDRTRLLDWIAAYRATGGRFAFDSNYRPRLWPDRATAQTTIEAAWRLTDIALPSVDDEMALYGDADADAVLTRLQGWGARFGALKCGADGPRPLDDSAAPQVAPVPRVVDSTAAGDSFNAGFLAAHLTGRSTTEALAAGHDLASQVIQVRGALMPRQKEPQT